MNPAAVVVVLLSLAALLLRRRESAVLWCVCGLAGAALLAPALRLADGVPSPAASLAADAPWTGFGNPAAGNDNLRDITYQVEPWLLFLRHEVRDGRLPFWNPYQAAGCPFWSNGSSAPLFPLHLLFALLPVQLGLVLLPWLRIVVAACGAGALARQLGVSRQSAVFTALSYSLCGTVTSFLLFPMSNAQALVPWVFLAVEHLALGTWGIAPLAVLGGLQLMGGHPETALYTALLTAVYLLVRGARGRALRAWLGLSVGWALAAAIAAVELIPLASTLPHTSRWLEWRPPDPVPFSTVGALLSRLVLPDLFGNPAHGTWWGPYNFAATAIYAGAMAPVLAAVGMWSQRRDRRWLAIGAMTVFATCAAYQLPGARHFMLALPVLGRGLHHYIKIGLELGLALLAGAGLDRWRAGRWRLVLASAMLLALLVGVLWMHFSDTWQAHGLGATELHWTCWVLLLAGALTASAAFPERWRGRFQPLVLSLAALDLLAAHAATNPGLAAARLYPRTAAIDFLTAHQGRLAGTGGALHPNAAMVYGLSDVRGDDSVKLARYATLYAEHLGEGHPTFFLPMDRWQDPWLDRLGVRWVMTGPLEATPNAAWRLAYAGADARIYERAGALPVVHWLAAPPEPARLTIDRSAPGSWDLSWRSAAPATVEVAEMWDPGWRAEGDRGDLHLEISHGALLGVPVGPGRGHIRLRYRPDGFALGLLASVLGLAATAGFAVGRRRSNRTVAVHPTASA